MNQLVAARGIADAGTAELDPVHVEALSTHLAAQTPRGPTNRYSDLQQLTWIGRGEGTCELDGRAIPLKAPVLGLYGAADQGIPVEVVEMFQDDLKAARSRSEIVVYPDAPHGFHADYRPSYRQSPADDGWKKLLDWFKRHGVA